MQNIEKNGAEKPRESNPRLRHCTLVDHPESKLTKFVVGSQYYDVTRDGDRTTFLRFKSLLDGHYTVEEIAQISNVKLDDVRQIVSQFEQHGLLQSRQGEDEVRYDEFKRQIEETSLMWRRQIGLHPLFGGLTEKTYGREIFVGLLIETYHYVRLLPQRISGVANQNEDSPLSRALANYAIEEADHHEALGEALAQLPRIGSRVSCSHPAAGTLSLLNNFTAIGIRNPFSLLTCLALVEARESEVAEASLNFCTLASEFDLEDVAEPFVRHMEMDVSMGHSDLLEGVHPDTYNLPLALAHEVVNDLHDTKHVFDIFHDSVINYYSDISNYIPRHRVDYFAL